MRFRLFRGSIHSDLPPAISRTTQSRVQQLHFPLHAHCFLDGMNGSAVQKMRVDFNRNAC
jgi:hypothetical protein